MRMSEKHVVWSTSSFPCIVTVVFQHSAPYRRTLNTLLLKILILVSTLRLVALHTGFCTTDPGVDLVVTVAGYCHFGVQIGEFFNVFYVFSINHDWVVHSSVLPQAAICLRRERTTNKAIISTFLTKADCCRNTAIVLHITALRNNYCVVV